MRTRLGRRLLGAALLLATGGCEAASQVDTAVPKSEERPALGLMTTLPIYWGEAADVSEALSDTQEPGWVRQALEKRYRLSPLDVLEPADLANLRVLLLAQPRALSGAENVALDDWVRAGGRLLLFADPMLTSHSRYPIGDRRRPQDVVLLSPILTHWGLSLTFDDEAAANERTVAWDGAALPVNLPGELTTDKGTSCEVMSGVVAHCRIGKGRILVVADAAVLEDSNDIADRADVLARLVARAFD